MDRITAERRAPFGGSPDVGERGRRTQQRLLAAALEVFDEVGYQAARIDAVTERAGCSRSTFYQYFASKQALYHRMGELLGASLIGLTEAFPGVNGRRSADGGDESTDTSTGVLSGDGQDELTDWVRRLVDLHGDWAPVFVAFRPALRGDTALTDGAAELTRRYGKTLDRSLPGAADDVDVELVAALVMTMLTGSLSLRSGGAGGVVPIGREADDETATRQLAAMLRRVLPADRTSPGATGKPGAGRRPAGGLAAERDRSSDDGSPAPDPVVVPESSPDRPSGVEAALEAAALVVFPRLGLEGTRVDDLVAEADVAHGTFYRYFSDKEELFERVAGRAAAEMFELLADLPAAVTEGSLEAWTEGWFAAYLGHGAILSVWAEAPPSEEGFSEAAAAAALDLLGPALAAAGLEDSPLVALAVLSLIEWSPYLVQQFDGFELVEASRAVAVILGRLLAPAGRRSA